MIFFTINFFYDYFLYNDLCTFSFGFVFLAYEKLGLESSGHEAGSAEALVPIILQCKIFNTQCLQ